jgi:holliday junction DNA helicase RuvA
MIGFLSGIIHSKSENSAVINVNGVGYEVLIAQNTSIRLGESGESATLEVYTHVNESTLQLYGFCHLREKLFFQKLIAVSGVGPKLVLSMLAAFPVSELVRALVQSDIKLLTSISGVGKKTSERLIIELKDKFKDDSSLALPAANDDLLSDQRLSDATRALMQLGYNEMHAKKVISAITLNENDTVQAVIKKSLAAMK